MTTVCESTLQKEVQPGPETNGENAKVLEAPTAEGVRAKPESFKTHCKHDSGSYEDMLSGKVTSGSSHGSSSSGCGSSGVGSPAQKHQAAVAVTVNGNNQADSHAHSAPPPRTVSAASMTSSVCADHTSSSSSLSRDLSAVNSFTSHEALEQLISDMTPEMADQEVVKHLLEHIVTLKLDMEQLRQENQKLKDMRSTMDDELHTLTENLFEEAYKMVDTVKEEKGAVAKKLADAAGKIDAMETEMSALKNLLRPSATTKGSTGGTVSTETGKETSKKSPSQHRHHRPSVKKAMKKISRKVKASGLTRSSTSSTSSCSPVPLLEHKNEIHGSSLSTGKVTPGELHDFKAWLSESVRTDHPYLLQVESIDVQPCLAFPNKELSERLLPAAKSNDLVMESLPPCSEGEARVCALSRCKDVCCTHRMQLGFSDQWYFISEHCRNRIVAACDFYTYIGHVEKGFIKLEAEQLYWQVARLRAMMNLARLNLELPD